MPRYSMVVSFVLPEDVSKTDAQDYVREAVRNWSGQFEPPDAYGDISPGDPRFGMGYDATVRSVR